MISVSFSRSRVQKHPTEWSGSILGMVVGCTRNPVVRLSSRILWMWRERRILRWSTSSSHIGLLLVSPVSIGLGGCIMWCVMLFFPRATTWVWCFRFFPCVLLFLFFVSVIFFCFFFFARVQSPLFSDLS